jgi:hypothetical protein
MRRGDAEPRRAARNGTAAHTLERAGQARARFREAAYFPCESAAFAFGYSKLFLRTFPDSV